MKQTKIDFQGNVMKFKPLFFFFAFIFVSGFVSGAEKPEKMTFEESLIQDMKWRNIGPANPNGRVSDIEALDKDFTTVIVGSASGGVWKSTNAGTTWTPIFEKYGSASIGDVAFFQKDPRIIWVGTGEKNCRNSIAWGDGIYKSTDGGETFENMGLKDTHSIGRIITHPENPGIVYAAAVGHLWGYSGDRGLYKTEDGGKTWKKLTNGLPNDGKTGAIELAMDPTDPDIIFAGFWQRLRRPYRFDSGGPKGGIFKTTDAGQSWKKLSNGLPEGDTGKIGLSIYRSDPKIIMAMVEHGFQPRERLRNGSPNPDYTDMTKLGSGVYRSEDGGESWKMVNRHNTRPFYYSHIYVNPLDDQLVYVLDSSFWLSRDGGKTFEEFGKSAWLRGWTPQGIHGDSHTMWLDPNNKDRFYIGDDGGVSLTHDHGHYIYFDNFVISQFYAVCVDMRDPYWVYGGLQDQATWGGPSRHRDRGILTDHWFRIFGGDGFHTQVDPTDWRTLYFESQGGSISRMNVETRRAVSIRPQKRNIINYDQYITQEILDDLKEKGLGRNPFRFNWSTPIVMSPHNPRTLYLGSNYLFKTIDRGDHWQIISPDLSKQDPEKMKRESGGLTSDVTGAETHCTIITVSESLIRQGLIWVGTDDGNVQVTHNGGKEWENVRANVKGVPKELWVSRVEASHFEAGTAYLSFDGHRSDNFKPWVFKTEDYGKKWKNISNNLPEGHPVYVIKEDLKNQNLLFVGTEFAVFYSLDGGEVWTKLNKNMPTVAVHDLVIHPREGDLVAGTHGRGIWILDDISTLQQATKKVLESEAFLFENRTATRWMQINRGGSRGHLYFEAPNPPYEAMIGYYLKKAQKDPVTLEISDIQGSKSRTFNLEGDPGIHKLAWNMQFDPSISQRKTFVRSITRRLNQQIKKADPEQKKQLEGLQVELEKAGTDMKKISDFLAKAADILYPDIPAQYRSQMGPRGPAAGPGTYLVKMTVEKKTYTSTITVRWDPDYSEN
jgi:photosystem II stability/assembly factor-like uncharacterized protein